jgi:hypothetical protein
MVIRNGNIVAEAYAPPFEMDMKHNLYSASKSVTSALIGIMLQEGYLDSLDTPMLGFFPDRVVQNVDANKEAITIRHLLTMSPGFACDDLATGDLYINELMVSEDWLQYALDMPMAAAPGTEFHYCNPNTYILSAIITEKTGMSALDYAAEKLFAPLGISDYAWTNSPQGISHGFGDLQLTPRDLAKFGYLYLREGVWDGIQIIPADFVKESMNAQINTPWQDTAYSYQWWVNTSINTATAIGWGGQYLQLEPNHDRIALVTGGFTENTRIVLHAFPFMYSSEALSAADEALPENPAAQQQLDNVIAAIERPEQLVMVPMPSMASQVTDQYYTLFGDMPIPLAGDNGFTTSINPVGLRFDFSTDHPTNLTFTLDDGEEWTLPISMNGIYRVSDSPVGLVGAKGECMTEDQFCVFLKYVGDARVQRFDMQFIPDAVNILGSEYTEGTAFAVQGVVME